MMSLEDLALDCGMQLTAAHQRGDLAAVAVLGPMLDSYADQWLGHYPTPQWVERAT